MAPEMEDTPDDLKSLITGEDDLYELLDLPNGSSSTEKDIRSAWKKAALKYHPDKVRAKDNNIDEATANDLYIAREKAYRILFEPSLRQKHDNELRRRENKKQQDAALTGKRKAMKDDLERRENAAKRRKGEHDTESEQLDREIERLRQEGRQRRMKRAEAFRKQAEEDERLDKERAEGANGHQQDAKPAEKSQVQDIDRVVKLRFPQNDSTTHLTRERVTELFSRFGPIESVTLKEKKVRVEGEKHRKVFTSAAIFFEGIVGAHAAVSDFADVQKQEGGDWELFEKPEWASGSEPACIPRDAGSKQQQQSPRPADPVAPNNSGMSANAAEDMDILMIRLKNAQKQREEERKRREEEAAAAANGDRAEDPPKPRRPMPMFSSFKGAVATETVNGDDVEKKREAERRRLEEEMRREEAEEELREN